jgi:hypothetical protein
MQAGPVSVKPENFENSDAWILTLTEGTIGTEENVSLYFTFC